MVVVAVDQQVEDQTMVHLKELLEVEALEVVELQGETLLELIMEELGVLE